MQNIWICMTQRINIVMYIKAWRIVAQKLLSPSASEWLERCHMIRLAQGVLDIPSESRLLVGKSMSKEISF
eukprot:187450-Pleurochrysis_carterae.AAC.1